MGCSFMATPHKIDSGVFWFVLGYVWVMLYFVGQRKIKGNLFLLRLSCFYQVWVGFGKPSVSGVNGQIGH